MKTAHGYTIYNHLYFPSSAPTAKKPKTMNVLTQTKKRKGMRDWNFVKSRGPFLELAVIALLGVWNSASHTPLEVCETKQ